MHSREERGAAAVEFAIVASLLLMLVFGIVDFGWMLNRGTLINNASREGAREAAVAKSATAATAAVTSALSRSGITTGTAPGDAHVTVTCTKASGTCDMTATSGATAPASGDKVLVTVTFDHRWITPVGATFGPTITLTKVTEMRVE